MTPQRDLVLLSARFPDLGGFTYPTLDWAVLALRNAGG